MAMTIFQRKELSEGGADDATLGMLDEIKDFIAYLARGNCLANHAYGVGNVEVTHIKNSIDLRNLLYLLL